MTLELRQANDAVLDAALPDGLSPGSLHIARTALAKLVLEGDDAARRLNLCVDLSLVGSVPEEQAELRLSLLSDAWAHPESLPAAHVHTPLTPVIEADREASLAYEVADVVPLETGVEGEGFWLKYLGGSAAPLSPQRARQSTAAPGGDLFGALARWLADDLGVGTVGGALSCARSGPAGVFGPVKQLVLERSGQTDLAVDGTRLAEASDAEDEGGEATRHLALYGERHGAWVLHRRRLQPRKARRKEPEPPKLFDCDVLVADSADDLIRLAGLGRVEKRLFQAAGVLQPDTLAAHHAEKAEAGEAPAMTVDLSDVADRPRRYLQTIIALAKQGGLNQVDLDLLTRTARQLARTRR